MISPQVITGLDESGPECALKRLGMLPGPTLEMVGDIISRLDGSAEVGDGERWPGAGFPLSLSSNAGVGEEVLDRSTPASAPVSADLTAVVVFSFKTVPA